VRRLFWVIVTVLVIASLIGFFAIPAGE